MLTLSSLSRLFRRTHAESTELPNAARGGARQATTWRLIGVIYFGSLSSDSNERPSLLLQHLWRGQDCWELLSPLHCSCMAQNRASHAPKLERKNLSDKVQSAPLVFHPIITTVPKHIIPLPHSFLLHGRKQVRICP